MTISGKPLSGPIVSGRPVRWPGPRPVPPGSAIPPTTPPPDPGPITPGPRGEPPPKVDPPDTIYPGGQPPTPDPTPSGIAPDWSDANVLTQHRAGQYRVRAWVRDALVLDRTLPFTGMTQQTYINECVHAHLRFAPNTDVEPWPVRPGMADSRKGMTGKERLMADTDKPTAEQELLAGLAELRHGLAVLGDQIANMATGQAILGDQIAALTARLDGQPTQPPAQPVDDDAEFWEQFLAAADPDPERFEPETFTEYSRGRVLYQWRAEYTPLGKRIYPTYPVALQMDYIRAMADPASTQARLFIAQGIDREAATYAILSGRVNDLFDTGFSSRPHVQIAALAGKSAADLFAADIAADKQGGTPGIGG